MTLRCGDDSIFVVAIFGVMAAEARWVHGEASIFKGCYFLTIG
jgi:hypothetical protein